MSLSWLDRLTLLVHPHSVELEHKPWRGQAERFSIAVPPSPPGKANWQPALDAANTLLGAHRSCQLRVVIANQFVRYALVPWSDTVLGNKARLAVAQALLRSSLGEQVDQFEIALDDATFGKNGLAAGVHRGLLDGLRQTAKLRRLRLGSIQPRLVSDLLAHRALSNEACFAFPDHGWLTLIGLQDGNPCLLRNHRAATEHEPLGQELLGMLTIECATVRTRRLYVFSAAPWPEELGEWRVCRREPMTQDLAHA